MKVNKLLLLFIALIALATSCKKGHYDVSNVQGVNAEGEVLTPVSHASISLRDMMERFELMDLVHWDGQGDMSLCFSMDVDSVLTGFEMLKFKDMDYKEHFAYDNPYQNTPPPYTDTVLRFERAITFESEHVFVVEGLVKSGRFDFEVNSNAGRIRHVVLRSPNIKDADGHDFELDIDVHGNAFGFDLNGYKYDAEEYNTLKLSYEVECRMQTTYDPELFLDININERNLAFSWMRGFVERYSNREHSDTILSLFPAELDGKLVIENARLKISERNSFDLGARLVLDTLTLTSQSFPTYSIFNPMPLTIDMPSSPQYTPVFDRPFTASIHTAGGEFCAVSDFIVNPAGVTDLVTIYDTCRIDFRADLEFPISFSVGDVTYLDTVNMNLNDLEMPELIEKLTLELTFNSLLPLNLNASFYMYNSETEMVTDTLLKDAVLIEASHDGQQTTSEISLEIDEERVNKVLHSNRIIMSYQLDSDNHDVALNINQRLDMSLKCRAKYKGNVEFRN